MAVLADPRRGGDGAARRHPLARARPVGLRRDRGLTRCRCPLRCAARSGSGRGLRGWFADAVGSGLPREFFGYALAAGLTTGGLVTFGIIGFHLTVSGLVPVAGGAARVCRRDGCRGARGPRGRPRLRPPRRRHAVCRAGARRARAPAGAVGLGSGSSLVGVAVWALAYGVQDSTVKALVAEVVEAPRRATAYGVFAGVQGAFAIVGGVGAGWLYDRSLAALVVVVAVTQLVALVLLARTLRSLRADHPQPV